MMSEVPLPMRASDLLTSHIRNMVPPTRVMTVEMRKNQPASDTTVPELSRPTAMP